jgi:hypothetical protein
MGYTPLYGAPSPRIPPYILSECRFGGDNSLDCGNKIFWKKMTFFGVFIIMNKSYSKIRHIQESNNRLEKRLLGEQESDPKQNYLSKGYVDVTDGFKKKTNPLQIPDGTYKCDGMGYSFKIITNDGKDTGYVVTMMFGVRGMITGPLTVSDNGTNVSVDFGDFNRVAESILYNEKLNQVKV